MEQNKKNSRVFYLTLAVVLSVVLVLIIATVVARRSSSTPTPDNQENENQDNNQNGDESTSLPTFIPPIDSEVSFEFSDSLPVFSQTMNDYRTHLGVDIEAELGTPVLAVADGTVTNIWYDHFMGNCISIEHSGNAVSVYMNLSDETAEGIEIGASVSAGDVISSVGESAMNEIAEEPHLHYELKINDKHVDPRSHITFPNQRPEGENSTGDGGNANNENNASGDSTQNGTQQNGTNQDNTQNNTQENA